MEYELTLIVRNPEDQFVAIYHERIKAEDWTQLAMQTILLFTKAQREEYELQRENERQHTTNDDIPF